MAWCTVQMLRGYILGCIAIHDIRRAEKEMAISEESLAKIAEIETQIREVTEKCVSAAEEGDIGELMYIR